MKNFTENPKILVHVYVKLLVVMYLQLQFELIFTFNKATIEIKKFLFIVIPAILNGGPSQPSLAKWFQRRRFINVKVYDGCQTPSYGKQSVDIFIANRKATSCYNMKIIYRKHLLAQNQINVSEWSDMFTCELLFQLASTIKIQLS